MAKKVSFIIPFYKKEKNLKKCVDSLLDQDYKDIEIIVVMDGQNNEAEGILGKFKDERIKSLTIEHGGASKARNEGFKVSTGEYVCFWDADCYAEPGMARVWIQLYEKMPEIDFIYSGYKFTDTAKGSYESEEFNTWKLTCNNYISSMTVMKREIFSGWDESLKSLQDWDLFLTLTEKGHKGLLNKGYAFTTEFPEEGSISFENCQDDVWLERKKTIREKHGIKDRDICVTSYYHQFKGYDIAQILNGDFDIMPSFHKHGYKMVYKIGFYAQEGSNASSVFQKAPKDCIKVIHWQSKDIESFQDVSYRGVLLLMSMLNNHIDYHFCESEIFLNKLKWLGIKNPIVCLLPVDFHDVPDSKEFSVCCEYEHYTAKFVDSIEKALPDIKFYNATTGNFKVEDIACYLGIFTEFYNFDNFKKFVTAGRYSITNFQLPYSGFLKEGNDISNYKVNVIEKIREIQKKWIAGERNTRAKDFWRKQLDKDLFINKIRELKKVISNND